MIKNVHNINVNVFEKNIEKVDKIKQVFQTLLPLDFKKEKIIIKHEKLDGFENKIIHSLTLTTKSNKHNMLLFETIFSKMIKKDIELLLSEKESRLNEEGFFYIRLNKTDLLKNNKIILTDDGNCFHIKIKLAAYPANMNNFYKSLYEILCKYVI